MCRTLGGIERKERGARMRGDWEEARQQGGGEPRRAKESRTLSGAANDCGFTRAALISWFAHDRLLHCICGFKKCLITHQAQMGTGNLQSHLDSVTEFQGDTAEVFLITNHSIFTVAWRFGTS